MSNLIKTYNQFPIRIVKGEGSFVWDESDKKYLDYYGGHAVYLLGHTPPSVTEAVQEQVSELNIWDCQTFCVNAFPFGNLSSNIMAS